MGTTLIKVLNLKYNEEFINKAVESGSNHWFDFYNYILKKVLRI